MKVIQINNKHKEVKVNKTEYGCVCSKCGSVFIFNNMDVSKPKVLNPDPKFCVVRCPNTTCSYVMSLVDSCVKKFNNLEEKYEFERKYDC